MLQTVFYFLLFSTVTSKYCSQTFAVNHSCSFYFSYSDNACSNFSFQFCIDDVNILTNASDWDTCINSCCPNASTTYAFSTLEDCSNMNNSGSVSVTKIIYILLACGIVVALLSIGVCWLVKDCRKDSLREEIYSTRASPEPIEVTYTHTPITQSQFRFQKQNWIININRNYNREQICPICLIPDTHFTTECGHACHRECLRQWFQTEKVCPLCRGHSTDVFLSYCHNCDQKYFLVKMKSLNDPLKILLCEVCQIKQNAQ